MVPDPLQTNTNQFTGKFNYYSRIEYSNLFKVENLLQNLEKTKNKSISNFFANNNTMSR
jgi:hypothetical protein